MPDPSCINLDPLMNLTDKQAGQFPWQTTLGHDHGAAEDDVRALYEVLRLATPRIAWASSPASMWRAVQILKSYAHKHAFVDSLVPRNGIESEAQRSVLLAILDTDVMTSTGAALKGMVTPKWGRYDGDAPHSRAICYINRIIASQEEGGIQRQARTTGSFASRQPRFHENAICPALYPESPRGIVRHSFSILPYARVCWLCMPPEYVRTDAEGYLHSEDGPAGRWSDGFEIWRNRKEELRLEAGRKALPAGKPEGQSVIDMLREAAQKQLPEATDAAK